jgi:transcriptional regulator with XRE-family HTH domain
MADTDGRSLGEVLRSKRVETDVSLRDLAKRLGLAPSYLSDIENDRRVPSEDVLQRIAAELNLKFDDLMARAGRFGDDAERYMKQHPTAGALFRRISDKRLPDEDLKRLLTTVERMGTKKGGP